MKKIIALVFTLLAIVLNVKGKDFLPIIEEGNEYDYEYYFYNWNDECHYTIYYTLKIEGDSLYNGKIYKKCHWNSKTVNRDTVAEPSCKFFTNGLIREENGKVWMLYDFKKEGIRLPYDYGSPTKESLIYNMNLDIDEDIEVVPDSIDREEYFSNFKDIAWYRGGKLRLVEKFQILIGVQERLVQRFAYEYMEKFEGYSLTTEAIEGIGAFNNLLLFPYPKTEMSGSQYPPPRLMEKRSSKGEIEFKREWYANAPTVQNHQANIIGGNGEIIIEGEYNRWSVMDISGRRWNTLKVPAGLYIVNVDGIPHKVMVK